MSYVGNKPAQATIPADDAVTTAMLKDDAVTSAKIAGTTIVNADVNASAGIALSKLASDPTYDDSGVQDDIAILGFKVAANGSLAKYNLVDQTIDDFQDASGISGSSTNEARDSAGKYYKGETTTSGDATGGTITYSGGKTIHTYTADGNFITPSSSSGVEYLIVAGGGGISGSSGGHYKGGGGAGGLLTATGFSVTAQTYAITVGAGGDGTATTPPYGDGGDSTAFGLTSVGGGFAGTDSANGGNVGGAGGSGGGGRGGAGSGVAANAGGAGTASQGSAGGIGGQSNGGGGGGGGAAGGGTDGTGGNAYGSAVGGNGGAGTQSSITGSAVYYSSGGGGQRGWEGSGSGTHGSNGTGWATAGYGHGGSGVGTASDSDGREGVVIASYTTNSFTTITEGANLTLVSTTTTAQAAPTKGDIVFTYTNGAGTTTLGTDVTAEYSADGGSTWTSMTLASEGTTGGHNIATAHDVSLTSTSGTSMAYRIKTLNQSASKTTRIQAVSLGWS